MRYIIALLFFVCAGIALAGAFMFGAGGGVGGGGGGGSSGFTCSGCWAEVDCTSATNCSVTSATKTVTGSGTLKFVDDSHTMQYSDNGGTFTTISNGGTLSWTSGHTLALKITGLFAGGDCETVDVTDNSGGGLVGEFSGCNVHA